MRGMGHGPVNPLQVSSMGGYDLDSDDEFVVTHLSSTRPDRDIKTSGDP